MWCHNAVSLLSGTRNQGCVTRTKEAERKRLIIEPYALQKKILSLTIKSGELNLDYSMQVRSRVCLLVGCISKSPTHQTQKWRTLKYESEFLQGCGSSSNYCFRILFPFQLESYDSIIFSGSSIQLGYLNQKQLRILFKHQLLFNS